MEIWTTNLPLATGESNVHETAGICDALLRATLGGLLLLLRLNLFVDHQHSIPSLFPDPILNAGRSFLRIEMTDSQLYPASNPPCNPPTIQARIQHVKYYRTFGV